MSISDNDLHRALTMHAHPFRLQEHRPESAASNRKPSSLRMANSSAVDEGELSVGPIHAPIVRYTSPSPIDEDDAERQGSSVRYNRENDPYALSKGLKTPDEIKGIRANTSRKRDRCTPSISRDGNTSSRKTRKLQTFYVTQNEHIERLLKPVDEHRAQAKREHGEDQLKFKIAVRGSFVANVILAILQVYGAVTSGSLSLFTTMADAIFDPLSNLTIILSNRAVNRVDPRRFPSGKARIETAGNIVFCFLMCSVSFILIVLSGRQLAGGSVNDTSSLHLPSVIAVAVALLTKLFLLFYCWSLKEKYSQIHILWEDHRNDIIINGFGLMTSVGGSKLKWWIDPMGAILLSILIAVLWLRTAYAEFQLLIGVSANPQMLQLITYISMTHSPLVLAIDTVRAYHSGPRMIVEVDVVMDPEESLRATHDVAEELQFKLESLPDVERAYVHVDYETTHRPEHFLKKEL